MLGLGSFVLSSKVALAEGIVSEAILPLSLDSYGDAGWTVGAKLANRIAMEPMNLWASLIFLAAILHTFLCSWFNEKANQIQLSHTQKLMASGQIGREHKDVSFLAQVFHLLGEIEAVFGIWAGLLFLVISWRFGYSEALGYLEQKVIFTEPMFIVVIMSLAATRPILNLAENCMRQVSRLGGESPAAWWWTILSVGPLMGSLITEPAAMTICALLLGRQFYAFKPSVKFHYATLGLLFVNISVGGTLTHFAAPPVLMVAAKWGWTTPFMLTHFGWHAVLGILSANLLYYVCFRKEFLALKTEKQNQRNKAAEVEVTSSDQTNLVPVWVTLVHILLIIWVVVNSHHPVMFISGFFAFLAFYQMTPQHQNRFDIQGPLLVGFFLAGLVIHGGLQGWWIAPVLGALTETPLMLVSMTLTGFNDNAAITYLATLVPDFSDTRKYAVVAGAVIGGGLTVIANAPNPAGQSLLKKFFPGRAISPLKLFIGALPPTLILLGAFLWI